MSVRQLKANTAVSVVVGPLIDPSDGYTRITSVTHANITCQLIRGVVASSLTLTASVGDNDFTHIGDGYWALELTASNITNAGPYRITFSESADAFLPLWEDFSVVPANVYDSLIAGTDTLNAEVASYASGQAPLQPTTAGRTLDVTTGGTAGVDWGNLENATTANMLDNTTIGLSTLVGSVTGSVATVNNLASTVLNAIRDGILNRVLAGNHDTVGSVGKVLQDAATEATLDTVGGVATANGAKLDTIDGIVDAIVVDTDTDIPALIAALNDPAAAAIADAIWDEARSGHVVSGSFGQAIRLIAAATAGKLSGAATTTNTIRNIEDDADAITATVDEDGNRTAVTYG